MPGVLVLNMLLLKNTIACPWPVVPVTELQRDAAEESIDDPTLCSAATEPISKAS
jgi:hypothetical protein